MNIYFSGIGGVAIGPLSLIALDAGYQVQGSDAKSSLVTEQLEARGIPLFIGPQDGHFFRICHTRKPIDLFVYTSALPHDHPELLLAKQLGIKTAKRDELIAQIIQEKQLKLLAVAGTHGKTTTTGMLIWTLKQLGIPVSYSVGTTISFGPSGLFDPKSTYFVYECDEFDRNFLHFSPYLSLITSIDYDHPDTYPTEADYMSAFREFAHKSSSSIVWQRDAERMAMDESSAWCLKDDEVANLSLAGEHNRRNGTLVLKALERLAIGNDASNRDALSSFPGTDRRFELLADNLYTDYGHHPSEIAATLQMAREISEHVVVVYQPHQNIRQHEVKDGYTHAFDKAEKIYWLPTYLSREDPDLPVLTPQELTTNLANIQAVEIADLNDGLWDKLSEARREGKLVLIMGAGSVDAWVRVHARN